MNTWLPLACLLLALLPTALFVWNLALYAPLPPSSGGGMPCSVLIPARNEEGNLPRLLRDLLHVDGTFEVVVLDDSSTDRTPEIVREFAAVDRRFRLESAPPLPPGWCGKQHACHLLAQFARYPLLVFVDADVRLTPDSLVRMSAFMAQSKAALASGVPRQETGTFSEKLLIPLIHFILLGFLPIQRMRNTLDPACSAGCGQLFVANREAYLACGGHAAIRSTLHDGAKLPRAFRAAGFATDLFDATGVATCRMFRTNTATLQGLARNAHEALGSPRLIGPATMLLVLGQVLPFPLALATQSPLAMAAAGVSIVPRFLGVSRFHQSFLGALLHPAGVLMLLAIQWFAFLRSLRGKPAQWKNRCYSSIPTA